MIDPQYTDRFVVLSEPKMRLLLE